jgi:chromosome partitioning protein
VYNKKGGVGKTTVVCNLAAIYAVRGRRTLVVDLDPQANATRYLLGDGANAVAPTVVDYFESSLGFSLFGSGERALDAFVVRTPFAGLDLVAAHRDLDGLESKLQARYKILKLRDGLRALDYDEVFIDTPPAMDFYSMSALVAADRCLIPFDCDEFSRHALYALKGHVREVAADHNAGLSLEGIVVNQYDGRARLPQQLVEELESEGFRLLRPFLSSSVRVRESHQHARPLVHYAPAHKLTAQYQELVDGLEGAPVVEAPSGTQSG